MNLILNQIVMTIKQVPSYIYNFIKNAWLFCLFSLLLIILLFLVGYYDAHALEISTQNDLSTYSEFNKIYVPSDYLSTDYSYRLSSDNILTIVTNLNCRSSYNTQYCTCYRYDYDDNLISNPYECNVSSNYEYTLDSSYLTSDISYSPHISKLYFQDKITYLIMIILGILFTIFLTKERSSY